MRVPDHIVCDVCGQAKGETNDWIMAIQLAHHGGIFFVSAKQLHASTAPEGAKYEDICGHACAAKRLSQYLRSLNPFTPKGNAA
jgi:hypothetical protein